MKQKIKKAFLTWNTYRLPTSDDELFEYFIDLLEKPIGLKVSINYFRN
jgi:hypothetical protein